MSFWTFSLPFAFLYVLAIAYLARWIAGSFVSEPKRDVAGFSFVLGMAFGVSGPISSLDNGIHQLLVSLGYVLGLCVVWYLFFKRASTTSKQ